MSGAGRLVEETLGALSKPRRLVPLVLVAAALIVAEGSESGSLAWTAADLVLLVAFCLFGPAGWRLARARPGRSPVAGYVAFVVAMSAVVVGLGWALPRALGLRHGAYVLDPSGLPLLIVLFVVGGWGLGRDVELEADVTKERERAARLALEAERAGLLALRANLDPHFLFNTLNAIAEWCREDPAVAEAATLKLASMLRTMLEGIRAPAWPLATELALVRALFELHAIRDRERYVFRVELPEPLPDASVPPMLLLPLVENAITHGPSAGHDGEVTLKLAIEGDHVVVYIENPGDFRGRRAGGEGIAMVERRIALAYGGGARLTLASEGGRTRARLATPLTPLAEAIA